MLTISVRRAEQLTDELLRLRPALVYVPLDELAAHLEKAAGTEHTSIGVSLPRVAWDREYPGLREKLEQVRALGVKDALLGNLGMFPIARELGFTLRGTSAWRSTTPRPSRSTSGWASSRPPSPLS